MEVEAGLLHPALIERIAGMLGSGRAGIVYVHLPKRLEDARKQLWRWSAQDWRIAGCRAIGNDYWLLAHGGEQGDRLDQAAADTARLLLPYASDASGGSADGAIVIGLAHVELAAGAGQAVETALYTAAVAAVRNARPIGTSGDSRRTSGEGAGDPGFAVIGDLAEPIPVFDGRTPVSDAAQLFERDPNAHAVVVTSGKRPTGLLMKEKLYQLLAGQFGLPLYWTRPVSKIMDDAPLVVDAGLPLEDVSQLAMARAADKLYDVIIITRDGQMTGAATVRAILESVTKLRTEAARSANPLTGLPGNLGIRRELARRIEAARPFAVVYADLDFFKWYNDQFGFGRGDDMIRYTADVIQQAMALSGTPHDYIGHIGGDDFIVLTETPEPERLCRQTIRLFEQGVHDFYDGTAITHVSDREGNRHEREGVTISLSLVTWDGEVQVTPDSFAEWAARLKKQAKSRAGSTYVRQKIGE